MLIGDPPHVASTSQAVIAKVLTELGAAELASVAFIDSLGLRHLMVATDRGLLDVLVDPDGKGADGALTPWSDVSGGRTTWTVIETNEPQFTLRIEGHDIPEPTDQSAGRAVWRDFVKAVQARSAEQS